MQSGTTLPIGRAALCLLGASAARFGGNIDVDYGGTYAEPANLPTPRAPTT